MLTNPVRLLAALPGPVRLLVIGTLVNKLGTFIMPYLTLVLRREFRLEPGQVGLLLAAQGVGSLAAILGVQGPASRFDRAAMRDALPALLARAGAISNALGWTEAPR